MKKILQLVDTWLNHQKHNIIEAKRILKQKDSEEHQHHALLVAIHTSLQVRTVFLLLLFQIGMYTCSAYRKKKGKHTDHTSM